MAAATRTAVFSGPDVVNAAIDDVAKRRRTGTAQYVWRSVCCRDQRDPSALGGVAGVDGEHRAGDVLGLIAEQEFDRVGHVIDVSQAPQRTPPLHLLAS